MPNVVIIHAPEDTLPARALAEKLRLAKLNVVLEKPPGEEMRAAIKSAQVTLALWSPRAAAQDDLSADVAFARSKSKLIHVCMQSAQPPSQFHADQSINLTGWRGEDDFPAWRDLAKLVTDNAGLAPLPPPAPRGPPGFFQPGRAAQTAAPPAARPQPRAQQPQQPQQARAAPRPTPAQPTPAPTQTWDRPALARASTAPANDGGGRGLMMGVIAFLALAAVGGGGYYFWNQSQSAQNTSAAWEELERNDPSALRAFIAGAPGDFREAAETALGELEERSFEAASDADTLEALQAFLGEFPESEHAIVARGRIAELESLPQTPVEALPLPATETLDPDLLPPGTNPQASGGPAPLTPPPADSAGDPLPLN